MDSEAPHKIPAEYQAVNHDQYERAMATAHVTSVAVTEEQTPTKEKDNKTSESPLPQLAPELRNMIWEYALTEEEEIIIPVGGKKARPGLLATSRQICAEALAMYYMFNTFCGLVNDQDYNGPSVWLADVSTANIQLIPTFTVEIRPSADFRREMFAFQEALPGNSEESPSEVMDLRLSRKLEAATDVAVIRKYVQTTQALVQAGVPTSAIVVESVFKNSLFTIDFAGWEYFISFSIYDVRNMLRGLGPPYSQIRVQHRCLDCLGETECVVKKEAEGTFCQHTSYKSFEVERISK